MQLSKNINYLHLRFVFQLSAGGYWKLQLQIFLQ